MARRPRPQWRPDLLRTARLHRPLMASGAGCLRSVAFGFLLFRPPSPVLGHPGDREEAPARLPVKGVDPEDIPNGETVVGTLDHPDRIACPHLALDENAQVRPGPQRFHEP